jgi:glyoxylase-like metal-dependent hydrolase (beta-lactamase superfamily II)
VINEPFSNGPWVELRPGIYTCTVEPESVTIGLVDGGQHVLLVDAGCCPAQGARLASSARDLLGRPVDRVVITHAHYDHWWGLSGIPDADSWGHESLEREAAGDLATPPDSGLEPRASWLRLPNHLISVAAIVDLGDRWAEVLHYGSGHTDTDLTVAIPGSRVVFVGDLLESANDPHFGPDATLGAWPHTLDGTLNSADADTLLIPGHGRPLTREEAAGQRDQIADLFASAERLVRRHVPLQEALDQVDSLIAERGWTFKPETVKDGLVIAYAEIGNRPPPRQLRLTPT